jgi:hypothetical protein
VSDAPRGAAFVREGMRLYNAGRFWEAHEAWEAVWRAAPPQERRCWQGLIQAAAAMLHRERGNAHGFATLGEAAIEKLAPPAPPGFPVETVRFSAALARCVREQGPVPPAEPAGPSARSESSEGTS